MLLLSTLANRPPSGGASHPAPFQRCPTSALAALMCCRAEAPGAEGGGGRDAPRGQGEVVRPGRGVTHAARCLPCCKCPARQPAGPHASCQPAAAATTPSPLPPLLTCLQVLPDGVCQPQPAARRGRREQRPARLLQVRVLPSSWLSLALTPSEEGHALPAAGSEHVHWSVACCLPQSLPRSANSPSPHCFPSLPCLAGWRISATPCTSFPAPPREQQQRQRRTRRQRAVRPSRLQQLPRGPPTQE